MQYLQSKVEVTNDGLLRWYLSVRWRYNADHSRIVAKQTPYVEKVASIFHLDPNSRSGPKTPMHDRFDVSRDDLPDADGVDPQMRTIMKKLLGSMLFPAGWCRPDCCYAVTQLSWYATTPDEYVVT